MKVSISLLVCLSVVAMSWARPEPPSSSYGAPSSGGYNYNQPGGGHGGDDHSGWDANYEFMYEVQDPESGNDFGHREKAMGQSRWGSYHVLLPDGRMQKVDYVADKGGYRPTVTYTGEASYGGGPSSGYGPPKSSYGAPAPSSGGYRFRRWHRNY